VPVHEVGETATAPSRPHDVARVNGAPITSDRLDAAVGALIPMESFHRNVSVEKMAELRQRALQTLVDDELQYQDGVRQAIKVSDKDVQAVWDKTVAQYGGAKAFDAALSRARTTRDAARIEIRRTLIIDKAYERSVTAQCQVSRDDVQRFFVANPDRFVEPEQLHIYAITVGVDPSSTSAQWAAARARAGQALEELKAGASFEATVLKYSTDPSKAQGGDMGFLHRGSLSETFERVARELPVGRFSDVIQTIYGYHIVRVSEVRPARKKSFEDVSATLQSDLTAARCAERKDAWLAGLRARASVALLEPKP
jgi:peptidyl-prolyl cis-trans isomerase C